MPARLPFLQGLRAPTAPAFLRAISSAGPKFPARSPTDSILGLDGASFPRPPPPDSRSYARSREELRRQRAVDRTSVVAAELRARRQSDGFLANMPRRFAVGDAYAPHDLSPAEMRRWARPTYRQRDVVDMLGVNPLDMYSNFAMVSQYMSTMGQIKHSKFTGLRPKNQRKIAKAIRRAIGMGIHPSIHRHPEILRYELVNNKAFRLS